MKNNFIVNYFVGSWNELKRVSWPTRKEVIDHTIVVLVSMVAAIAITSAIDYSLTALVQYFVTRQG